MSENDRREIDRALRDLEPGDLDEKDEVELWRRIKSLAPKAWDKANPIIYQLVSAWMKRELGL